jgi:hypothetical protein
MMRFVLKVGDRLPSLALTLEDEPGKPAALTHGDGSPATVELIYRRHNTATGAVTRAMTIVSTVTAEVRYDWQAAETDIAAGLYDFVVRVTRDGKAQSFPAEGFGQLVIEPRL